MLALQPGMDRLSHELSAQRDRLVRLQSVQTDIALDLPPSIPLPDGEEIPYGSATRLKIRDPEQVIRNSLVIVETFETRVGERGGRA